MCRYNLHPSSCSIKKDEATNWTDEGAPFPSQTFTYPKLLWFPLLTAVTTNSIHALNDANIVASVLWILYESYIVFDHVPFLFTDSVYKSPKFNFTHLSTIFFWGLEAVACIVATQSLVNAPNVLLYNALPHCFFIVANNFQGKAASKSFVVSMKKSWWVSLQVFVDDVIHATCLWYHLKYIFTSAHNTSIERTMDSYSGSLFPWLSWISLLILMFLLTYWVHMNEMSWKYFWDQLKC